MAAPVRLPRLGLTMEGGTLVGWRIHDGEPVEVGQVLYDLETEKAVLEVEAEAAGYLRAPRVHEGEYVLVGTLVAWITATPDEPLPADAEGAEAADGAATATVEPAGPVAPGATAQAPPPGSPGATAIPAAAPDRPRSSPFARRTAQRSGIDWRRLEGSGPGGRVVARDVEAAASLAPGRRGKLRAATAQRTSLSAAIPQFAVSRVLDFSLPAQTRAQVAGAARVSYTDFLLQGALAALAQVPQLHASYRDGRIVRHPQPVVGLAVATPDGLIVPVLRPGFGPTLAALAAARAAVVERARAGHLTAADWGEPTFVLSNLGPLGVDRFQALLDPAAGTILAAGAVRDRCVVRDGAPAVAPCCELTLTVDHRLGDGADAAAFLAVLAAYCERGEGLRVG